MRPDTFMTWGAIWWLAVGCTSSPPRQQAVAVPDSVFRTQGQAVVSATFDTLRASLLAAIGQRGLPGAVAFCQVEALPITARLSSDSIRIRRTALRYRNPHNQPDSLERVLFAAFDSAAFDRRIVRTAQAVHYFQPIRLQAMCRSCHGTPGLHIDSATYAVIQSLYPHDRAIRFEEGDLRGLWHVQFYLRQQ